jgi:hypothetical protein
LWSLRGGAWTHFVGHVADLEPMLAQRPVWLRHDHVRAMAVGAVVQLAVAAPHRAVQHLNHHSTHGSVRHASPRSPLPSGHPPAPGRRLTSPWCGSVARSTMPWQFLPGHRRNEPFHSSLSIRCFPLLRGGSSPESRSPIAATAPRPPVSCLDRQNLQSTPRDRA